MSPPDDLDRLSPAELKGWMTSGPRRLISVYQYDTNESRATIARFSWRGTLPVKKMRCQAGTWQRTSACPNQLPQSGQWDE
jgi:hypothetical protein